MPNTSELTTSVITSVDDVPEAEWNALAADHPFANAAWYRYGEAIARKNTPCYVLIYDGQQPIARATYWITREESIPVGNRLIAGGLRWLLERRPLLVCRAPAANYAGIILPEGPQQAPALEAIIAAGEQIAAEHRCSAILYDYLKTRHQGITWPTDYRQMAAFDPGTRMDVVWETMDAYVTDLKKKRRQDYKKNQKLKTEEGITIEAFDHIPDVDEALPLLENLLDKYSIHTRSHLEPQLRHVDLVHPIWIEARQDGALVACLLILGDGTTANLQHLGRAYEISNLYFLMMDESIRYAIQHKVKVLRAGSKVYGAKLRRGFELEEGGHVVFRARIALLNLIADRMISDEQ